MSAEVQAAAEEAVEVVGRLVYELTHDGKCQAT